MWLVCGLWHLWSEFSNLHHLSEQLFQGREGRRLYEQYGLNLALWSVYRGVIHCTMFVVCLVSMQWNPNIVPLFVHCSLWQYIEGACMLKYCVIGNFCSWTSICAKRVWLCVWNMTSCCPGPERFMWQWHFMYESYPCTFSVQAWAILTSFTPGKCWNITQFIKWLFPSK